MLRRPARNRFVAWLAMLAICLLASAPTFSRVIAAASAPVLSGGVEHAHAGHADSHVGQHADGRHVDEQHPDDSHADHMDACGYCILAAQGSTLADAIAYSVPMLPAAPLAVARDRRDAPPAVTHRPPARGPPLA